MSSNEKAKDLHSHAEDGVGSGSGMVDGSGDRSVTLLYDWSCGSESGCPHCPNHGVCESCDCAFCGPPCCNPFDPSCSGWVMGLGLSPIASTTKPGLSSATYSPLYIRSLGSLSKLINTSVNRCNTIPLYEPLTISPSMFS